MEALAFTAPAWTWLPEQPPEPPRAGGRWLAWLTKPEDLDQNGR